MHIKRKGTHLQGCGENTIYCENNLRSFVKGNYKDRNSKRILHTGKLCNDNTWTRLRHCISKVFCKHEVKKDVPYASLTRLDRLSVSEDELQRAQKKLWFCFKREYSNDNDLSGGLSDDELDCHYDSILRERVERSRSFTTRRMAICKEIERNTEGNKNTSLLELRKTLIVNNRFKEMGL